MQGQDSILYSLVVREELGYLGRAAVWTNGPLGRELCVGFSSAADC